MLAMQLFGADRALITPGVGLSLLALAFTVGSFWWIQVRRGKLRAYPPSTYAGVLEGGPVVLVLPIVLYNDGPAPIVVLGLRLKLDVRPDGNPQEREHMPVYLGWQKSHPRLVNEYNGSPPAPIFASPFPVEGRKAVERFFEFQWREPRSDLRAGPYVATVEVQTAHQQGWRKAITFPLHTEHTDGSRRVMLPRPNNPDFYVDRP